MSDTAVDLVRRWLAEADRIVNGAGAGLSAAAGFDYTDTRRFAELFPALHRRGLRARYQLIGARLPTPLMWGYWATHVADIRFGAGPHPVYERLRAVVGDRDHFVLSSNVDGLFTRNGFEPERVFTPQGDYARYQCEIPCTREMREWLAGPAAGERLVVLDIGTGFNTPGVVRLPMERLALAHPGARLIRINRDHPEVPAQLGDRAIGLAAGAETVFTA